MVVRGGGGGEGEGYDNLGSWTDNERVQSTITLNQFSMDNAMIDASTGCKCCSFIFQVSALFCVELFLPIANSFQPILRVRG